MGRFRGRRPSPATAISIVALVVAVAGSAFAGVATISVLNKKEKKQTRKIARDEINKAAPSLSVANATNAGSANTAGNAQTAQSAQTAQKAGDAELLDGFDSSDFAGANAARSVGPILVNLASGETTQVTLFTVGSFTVSRNCADLGAQRSSAILLTSSQDGGHVGIVAGIPSSSTPVSTEVTVDDVGVLTLAGSGDTAAPDLGQSFVTMLAPGGEARTAILYAGANILGTDCVFGYTLFSP